jgi:WD40 repeat protein
LISISPDQSLIAVSMDLATEPGAAPAPVVKVLDLQSGKVRGDVVGMPHRPVGFGWTEDAKTLLIAAGFGVRHVSTDTFETISDSKLPHHYRDRHTGALGLGVLGHASFVQGGDEIVTCGALPEICGWTLATAHKNWTMKVDDKSVVELAVSPDAATVACLSSSGDQGKRTLRVFDVASQRELTSFDLGSKHSQHISYSPDGHRVLVGFRDGTTLIYDVAAAVAGS